MLFYWNVNKKRIDWGYSEKYYNSKYSAIEYADKMFGISKVKKLQQLYKELGGDVSNQVKVKTLCRQYDVASEIWVNIMSAEVCGGEVLEYVKEYLPIVIKL